MNSCPGSHANILIRNQLKIHVLHKDCKCNNRFQQSKLITNTLTWAPTKWNESEICICFIRHRTF